MDTLARVAEPGRDLLARVDAVLAAAGAPDDHPVWPLLRRVGALPGDVLEAFCALAPDQLAAAAERVRARAQTYAEERADLASAVAATEWTGASASAFEQRWAALADHLGGTPAPDAPSLAGRLAATASYVDDVAAWMRSARQDLAHEVATALGSREALRLRLGETGPAAVVGAGPAAGATGAGPAAGAEAAATIGAAVLAVADRQAGVAEDVAERWAGRLVELPFRPGVPAASDRRGGPTTQVPL
jgi:hypothetical protein